MVDWQGREYIKSLERAVEAANRRLTMLEAQMSLLTTHLHVVFEHRQEPWGGMVMDIHDVVVK